MVMSEGIDVLILTLGFEPGPLVGALASKLPKASQNGITVIVFVPSFKDERAERAWRQLSEIFEMMKFKAKNATLIRYVVDLHNFSDAIYQISSLLSKYRDKRVFISLTGGMRALILAVFISYLLVNWKITPEIEVFLEGRGESILLPPLAGLVGMRVGEKEVRLLAHMESDKVYKVNELCSILNKDRSTVYRYLRTLLEHRLVEKVDEGVKLTALGVLISKFLKNL